MKNYVNKKDHHGPYLRGSQYREHFMPDSVQKNFFQGHGFHLGAVSKHFEPELKQITLIANLPRIFEAQGIPFETKGIPQ